MSQGRLLVEVRGQREYEQGEADEDGDGSDDFGEVEKPERRGDAETGFGFAFGEHPLVFERALVLELFLAFDAGEDDHIHRETVGTQVRVDEVEDRKSTRLNSSHLG